MGSRREPRPSSKKKRRDEESSSSEDEDTSNRLPYFVPEEGIDIEPLAGYVRGLLDSRARVRIGSHPSRRDQKGFWIESIVAIGGEDIRAMIEDTRLWRKENADGYYVNSATMKRRRQIGRPQAAKERPIATAKAPSKDVDEYRTRQASRSSVEPDPRYPAPNPLTRASVENVPQRQGPTVLPSPRPASAQPMQTDPRRPSNVQQYPPSQQFAQASIQYTASVNMPQSQYSSYDSAMTYDTAPPPYSSDTKRGGGGGGGGQPSTTGSQGFSSMYATSGGPPRSNQGQRRHDR